MENTKTVYCFGDCNVDMIIPIDSLPVCGGCCFSNSCMTGAGGSMLNTATALHRLGISVMPITKIGNDFLVKQYLIILQNRVYVPMESSNVMICLLAWL